MNIEEKIKLDKMEQNVEIINNSISEIKSDVLEIKSALLGSTLSGEKGIVGRLNTIDLRQDDIELEIKSLRDERVKNTVYIKLITWLVRIIGAGVILAIINYLKK